MPAAILLAQEIVGLIGPLAQLGLNVTGLVLQTRAVLDENAAPGNAQWDALDAQIKNLQAELAKDPA